MSVPTITELSHRVAATLREERSEAGRFRAMDLCADIMRRCDLVSARDDLMRETLRGWIGKVQAHHGLQPRPDEVE